MIDAISIERLTKHYGPRRVVDVVNLRIPTGCVYGFLGRNGAGKSTLIKMLLGMVQPDAGHATLLGEEIQQLRPATRARIAYLAEGHPLHRWMTVSEAIRFTRRFYDTWQENFLDSILDHFRLSLRQKIGRLSNGQRAQLSLALALAPDPELLILDDPTLGLDTVVRRDFLESMIHLIQRSGRTIFFSSHILGDVERVADRIGIVIDGVLRVDCPTDHFKSSLRKVALEFTGSVPELPPLAGLVSQRQYGGKLELTVVGYGQEQAALVESLGAASVDVVEMNLEDAFIAYTRDPAPPLPSFEREMATC
ncbi:MAG TPA: ABC transporter ATP-binding protein [Pirellulales bacterium]|jgi:ABC-2 type transport system ATP-binding protein|nr:ABC transporter ATP-binding protein [Pirellulales bacterium]